jgi:hypothetical protein
MSNSLSVSEFQTRKSFENIIMGCREQVILLIKVIWMILKIIRSYLDDIKDYY